MSIDTIDTIELRFHPSERCMLTPVRVDDGTTPIAYVGVGQDERGGVVYDVTSYYFHFDDNYATGCGSCCFPESADLGFHDNDFEHISIYYLSTKPIYVLFAAHSPGQGLWKNYDECEFSESGNLVVYSALNSHGSYPHAGRYARIFFCANDYCSKLGKRVVLSPPAVTTVTSSIYNVLRNISVENDGIKEDHGVLLVSYDYSYANGIHMTKGIGNPLPSHSITRFQRFFLSYYVDSLRDGDVITAPQTV